MRDHRYRARQDTQQPGKEQRAYAFLKLYRTVRRLDQRQLIDRQPNLRGPLRQRRDRHVANARLVRCLRNVGGELALLRRYQQVPDGTHVPLVVEKARGGAISSPATTWELPRLPVGAELIELLLPRRRGVSSEGGAFFAPQVALDGAELKAKPCVLKLAQN